MKSIKKMFLIDDDEVFVFITRKTLESIKIIDSIEVFEDGDVAIRNLKNIVKCGETLPDLIFLDLSMPVMDGWGFLSEYNSIEPLIDRKITIYIYSSSISPHDIERSKTFSTVSDFIIKPISNERFIDIVKTCTEVN